LILLFHCIGIWWCCRITLETKGIKWTWWNGANTNSESKGSRATTYSSCEND
jgi:hypothetical protein